MKSRMNGLRGQVEANEVRDGIRMKKGMRVDLQEVCSICHLWIIPLGITKIMVVQIKTIEVSIEVIDLVSSHGL